jgi:hypothetical protein
MPDKIDGSGFYLDPIGLVPGADLFRVPHAFYF